MTCWSENRCCRFYANALQEPLPAAAVQEDRRCRIVVKERKKPPVHNYFPNTFHIAEVHAAVWVPPIGLQRSSLYLRWGSSSWHIQGKIEFRCWYKVMCVETNVIFTWSLLCIYWVSKFRILNVHVIRNYSRWIYVWVQGVSIYVVKWKQLLSPR